MKPIRVVRREEKVTLEVSAAEVRKAIEPLLKEKGIELPERNVDIYVRVPGGGDWSNTNLELDSDTPLCIHFTIIEEDDDEDKPEG